MSRRVGRRPGDPAATKQAILDAARRTFGDAGFERATIRTIAAEAGVDPALVLHHFGSKQELFVAAHELPVNPAAIVAEVRDVPPAERGAWLARSYLRSIVAPGTPLLSLLRAAATNAAAAAMLREFLEDALLHHAHELVDAPDAELRVALAGSQLVGVIFAREVVGLAALRAVGIDELAERVAPSIQRHLDEHRR